tara:strand:+ start:1508 stop:1696 length:189 start_codon:yes stop_codon:yes gene_type:complete
MTNRIKKAVIVLDMILLAMTGTWIIFSVSRGIDIIELIYNYIYILIVTIAIILNMKIIYRER